MTSGYAKMYMEWLAENEPEYLRQLLQNHQLNKLEHQIDQKLAQAAVVVDQAKKSGLSPKEAHNYAIEEKLARGDGRANTEDPAPEPLSLADQEKVYRKLERRQEIMNLLSAWRPGQAKKSSPPKLRVIRGGRTR